MHKTFGNMIQSMTGYGKATAELPDKKINVEIKSLNSKAMDLSARIAPAYREKEMEISNEIERRKTKVLERVDYSSYCYSFDTLQDDNNYCNPHSPPL